MDIPKNTYFCVKYQDMKKLIVLLSVFTLFSCQKYEQYSPPKVTGGKWIFTGYEIVDISSISPVTIVKNDTVCIGAFNLQTVVGGNVSMKQDFQSTALDRKFIKGKTTWEFDSNNTQLYVNYTQMPGVLRPDPFWVNINSYYSRMEIMNTTNGSTTNYTVRQTQDVGYATTLTLVSPDIVTDLYLANGTRSKAVTVRVTLYFSR
jgi:hypothetical protein